MRVCFVAPNAYPILAGRSDIPHIGGAELQQHLLAEGLRDLGHEVSFVTHDHGQQDGCDVGGIRVWKASRPASVRSGRWVRCPAVVGLWRAMWRADADVYYNRMSEPTAGIVAAFCRTRGRRFVFGCAHKWDCIPSLPTCASRRARAMYRFGLRRADQVIAQTVEQQELLRTHFGVPSTVLHNCGRDYGCLPNRGGCPESVPPARLLWIGRFAPEKRLDRLIELAQLCPEIQFDVVGEGSTAEAEQLCRSADTLANLRRHGRVPHARMPEFYRCTAAVVCTSVEEGFPNTFLEAWSHGLPVVSTCDADNLIQHHALGVVAPEIQELARLTRQFLADHQAWRKACARARAHFVSNHSIGAIVPQFEKLLGDARPVVSNGVR